ncbi:hypothetical protein [Bifidobacterium aerophilum]|uniref:hypothetical protein n=1 Tax=Bifidobacterium aerophilum TaxID=1798155 RepID=UPI0013D38CB4|nr:hypothetical protein [Bifidobacterium aerophilum]
MSVTTTIDLSEFDAVTAYRGLPTITDGNPVRFFSDVESVSRCVNERMQQTGMTVERLADETGVPVEDVDELARTGLTSIGSAFRVFDRLGIRTSTLPAAYAGRITAS